MIDFSSFVGSRFPLASTGGAVVEGLDWDRWVDGWPNDDVGLLRMGGHSFPAMYDVRLRWAK